MRVLLTGGAGYIGTIIAKRLIAQKFQPVIYDNLTTGFRDSVPDGVKFVLGDVRDETLLSRVMKDQKIESVIHLAAKILPEESMKDPLAYYDNNLNGTIQLLKACKQAEVKKLVFSSTAAVYGNPQRVPICEDDPTEPISPYGLSKKLSEIMIKECASSQNLKYVILRYFNVAGGSLDGKHGQRIEKATHLVTLVARAAMGRQLPLKIFGTDYDTEDGTAVRDYIHVEDLAKAHLLSLKYLNDSQNPSEIFNCGYGYGTSVKKVISEAEKIIGRSLNAEPSSPRAGDPARIYAQTEKIKKILGWEAQHEDIQEIIKSALKWEEELLAKEKHVSNT